MALPSSGPITMAQVAAEIGISASGLSLNDSRVRQLAGKPSGAISFADLRGKSWLLPPTITFTGCTDYYSYNGGYYFYNEGEYCRINYVLGGGPGTLSIARIAATKTEGDLWRVSLGSTQASFSQAAQPYQFAYTTIRITVTNARGSAYIDVKIAIADNTMA